MKILLVDCREERGQILTQALGEPDRRVVKHSEHVNGVGGGVLDDWNNNAKQSCDNHLNSEAPDMVMLHVGRDQRCWGNCLKDIYRDHVVVCFTGAPIPQEVKNDCAIDGKNPKHCYYPGLFEPEYSTANDWRQSAEGCAILKFINGMEEYLKKAEDSPQEAEEILQKAKETLQQFDSELENALNGLTKDLRELLVGSEPPTKESIDRLAAERNRLLGDNRQ